MVRRALRLYRLEGRLELLPHGLWADGYPRLWLPPVPGDAVAREPWFWAVDGRGERHPLAWPGGTPWGDGQTVFRALAQRGWAGPRPFISRLPLHPHRLPPAARHLVRQVLLAASRLPPNGSCSFPRWPIEPSWEVWKAVLACCSLPVPSFRWPEAERYGLCLSHDVDTAAGQCNVLALARIEEDLGLRSAWFLAPGNYRIDRGLWGEMTARGHEVAAHGLRHDFKLPYLSPRRMAARLDRCCELLAEFGAAGFRSPAFLRTPPLVEAVAARFVYDSSVPDTLRLHGPDGTGCVFPWRLGPLVEVPVTLPYDGELLALGLDARACFALWCRKAAWIRQVGGLVHLLTHPDPRFTADRSQRELYRRTLAAILEADGPLWHGLPVEAARVAASQQAGRWQTGEPASGASSSHEALVNRATDETISLTGAGCST